MFEWLPYEIVCKILSYLDTEDFISTSLSCKVFKRALNDVSTWSQRLQRHGIVLSYEEINDIGLEALKLTYKVWGQNLLENPNCDKGLEFEEDISGPMPLKLANIEGWTVNDRGCFKLEKNVGLESWPAEAGFAHHNVATAYDDGVRSQTIRLESKLPVVAQQLKGSGRKVEVHWSVWVAPRFKRGSQFTASLSWSKGSETEHFELARVDFNTDKMWRKLEKVVVLDGCDNGVFEYKERGNDSRFWPGYFGVKILNPTITIKIK